MAENTTQEGTVTTQAQNQTGSAPAGTEPTVVNYDEAIKTDKVLQSWLDKRIGVATQSAVAAALEKERLLNDEKVSEAEKLAKMTKDEKTTYELEKLKKQVAAYEAEKAAAALKAEALKLGGEQGVPAELIELLPFGAMTAEEVSQKVTGLKAAFDQAVSKKVKDSLSSAGTPQGGPSGVSTSVTKEQFNGMDYQARLALKRDNPQLYNTLK